MKEIEFIGDVHLGRKFTTGVPLHRRGDREAMVWQDFEHRLMNPGAEIVCQVGDLFNEFSVPEALVLKTFRAVAAATLANPETVYIFIMGNHDGSRDADKKSSFEVFQALCDAVELENLWVLTEPMTYRGYGFIPWNPFKSSTELAVELTELRIQHEVPELKAVVGHWDTKSFGNEFNLIPVPVLKHVTKTIYTGHEHLPKKMEIDGVEVIVTGSMQPYAHGEDPGTDWYITVPYAEFLATPPEQFKNKNVRVLTKEGDVVIEIDCLSIITKRVEEVEEECEVSEVSLEEFDIVALFRQCLTEKGVGESVSGKLLEKFKEVKHG